MKCPNDNATLLITERNGIEIDYCPECRGVWLDRGELDKIIDRAAQPQTSSQPQVPREQDRPRYDERQYGSDSHKKRRKESFLGDLFDF